MKTKFMRIGALIFAAILFFSALIIPVSANDSVFLETLIDTDRYVYVANFVMDTATKNKKYAYKYVNMAYVLFDGCEGGDGDLEQDPNKCFRLNSQLDGGKLSGGKNTWSDWDSTSNLNVYMLLEGYFDESQKPIENDKSKASVARAQEKHICSTPKKTASPLSYPGYYTVAVTTEQSEYAQQVHSATVRSLNGILAEVNDNERFTSVADLVNKSILIRPDDKRNIVVLKPNAAGYSGYVIVYADLTNTDGAVLTEEYAGHAGKALKEAAKKAADQNDDDISVIQYSKNFRPEESSSYVLNKLKLPRASSSKGLYCYIFPLDETQSNEGEYKLNLEDASYFVYAWPKGYMDITYGSNDQYTFYNAEFRDSDGTVMDYTTSQGDSPWISVHMLAFYANTVYKQEQLSIGTYVEPNVSTFNKILAGIFEGMLGGIRAVLQLSNIDELIFNLGDKGSAANNYGLMKEDWWSIVLQYQLLFQALAWVVLICGFIKTLISLNLSTINPQKRATVYDTVQKFIVVGIGLVVMIPVVQFMLECNDAIVELFASQVDTSSLNMPLVTNAIVQIIVGFVWMTLMLYINFIYIMRSVTVAILIASGPFFISTMAFSKSGSSSLFVSWGKELIANVFVQSVHAFILSFLLQLMTSGRFLETFAIVLSIIPLTEMFRGLIFAGAGGSTSQMAKGLADLTQKGIQGAARGLTTAGAKLMSRTSDSNQSQSEADGKDGGGPSGGGGGGKGRGVGEMIQAKNAQRIGRIGALAGSDEKHKGWKIAGNVAAIAGTSAFSAVNDIGEIGASMQNFALTGDTSTISRATEAAVGNVYGAVSSTGGSMVQAYRDHKAKQGSTPDKNKTIATDQDRMGVAAFDDNTGQTQMGGGIVAESNLRKRTAYKTPGQTGTDFSGLNSEERLAAMADFKNGKNGSSSDVMIRNASGQNVKGKLYSYESGGKSRQFLMSDPVAQETEKKYASAVAAGQSVQAAYSSNGAEAAFGEKIDNAVSAYSDGESENAAIQHELARQAGNVQDAINENGEACKIAEYAGNSYLIPEQENTAAAAGAREMIKNVAEGNGKTQMSASLHNLIKDEDKDWTVRENTGDYTNAALLTMAGDQAKTGDGRVIDTGMSRDDAKAYLRSVGISNVKCSDGTITYTQSKAPSNGTLYDVRHHNGRTVAQHKLNIGKEGGPQSFVPNAYGGGTFVFGSAAEAEQMMRKTGNVPLAESIATVDRRGLPGQKFDDGIATLKKVNDHRFEISYDNKAFRESGIRLEQGAGDRSSLFVSSTNGDVINPFYANANPIVQEITGDELIPSNE